MVNVLRVLMPVAVMIAVGMLCRKLSLLDRSCVDGLKFLTTKIILPAAIFNALATAGYDSSSLLMVSIMLAMLVISFGIGYLMRPLMSEPYRKYLPFMVSVYEGGMMGYPLYANLVGSQHMSNIALLDIAGLLFGFSIYMSMLTQTEEGKKLDTGKMLGDALRNPSFIAAVAGLAAGLSGLILRLQQSAYGPVYDAVISMVTAPLSAVILLAVGYEIAPQGDLLRPCLRTVLLRALLQAFMIAGVLTATHLLIGKNTLTDLAIICYMSSPATFSMQTFLKTRDASAYASTTNSVYCFVSILVYAALAVIYL